MSPYSFSGKKKKPQKYDYKGVLVLERKEGRKKERSSLGEQVQDQLINFKTLIKIVLGDTIIQRNVPGFVSDNNMNRTYPWS